MLIVRAINNVTIFVTNKCDSHKLVNVLIHLYSTLTARTRRASSSSVATISLKRTTSIINKNYYLHEIGTAHGSSSASTIGRSDVEMHASTADSSHPTAAQSQNVTGATSLIFFSTLNNA
jgi:hypothetical protein